MSNPETPDDTLQKLLSRRAAITDAYNVTDALTLDELNRVRKNQLDNRANPKSAPEVRNVDRRGKNYWFGAR